jgi:hypothetical protein
VACNAHRGGWIVSPLYDLLFISNIHWVLALLPVYVSADGEPYVQFWMAYFLATPHRWLTLVVAGTDRDRRYGQTWLFVLLAIGFAVLVGGVLWATGDFRHLFLFYTLLLGCHFAGQHRFVWRVYCSRSSGNVGWVESWLPWTFIVYVNIRLVSFVEPLGRLPGMDLFGMLDWVAQAVPIVLLVAELWQCSRPRLPKLLYLASCLGLWSAVLVSQHFHQNDRCSVLLAAVTMFHSVEYLALVSYYASRRRQFGSKGLFQTMAANWTFVFAWYVVGCGLLYSLANATFVVICFGVNTWASLLHCAYDGIMWRLGDRETAHVFEIQSQLGDA